jgi:DnaJ-class molecular chaperone with C-terminal Zn finger domain
MFFMFSSIMLLLAAGCGKKDADSGDAKSEFKFKVIEAIQNRISQDIPLQIDDVTIVKDESKTTDSNIFGNFTAAAITTENLYEQVQPGTDLKRLAPDYLSDDELSAVKSSLDKKLQEIRNSANSLPKTSAQYAAIMEKNNAGHMLLTSIRNFESYSFATLGVAQGVEISVAGTIGAVLSDAKKWEPDEIEISGMELYDMELSERSLFVASKMEESVLIIGKNGTSMAGNKEIARRKEVVDAAIKAVGEAEKAVADALAKLGEPEKPEERTAGAKGSPAHGNGPSEVVSPTVVDSLTDPSHGHDETRITEDGMIIINVNPPNPPNTLNKWYTESEISALIRTNANAAVLMLSQVRKSEPNKAKHHYWSALAYYKMGGGITHNAFYNDARNLMVKAVELNPKYKNDPIVKETPCAACKGIIFETCKKSSCYGGKVQKTCITCNQYRPKDRWKCPDCRGTRKIPVDCPECKGTGKIKIECAPCNSTGKFFGHSLGAYRATPMNRRLAARAEHMFGKGIAAVCRKAPSVMPTCRHVDMSLNIAI